MKIEKKELKITTQIYVYDEALMITISPSLYPNFSPLLPMLLINIIANLGL